MTCPVCSRDVWLYDSKTWTCKDGHHTAADVRHAAVDAPLAPSALPRRAFPSLPLLAGVAGGIVAELLNLAIGALT